MFALILVALTPLARASQSISVSPRFSLDMDTSAWTAGRGQVAAKQPMITIFSNKKNPNFQIFVSDDVVSGEKNPRIPSECRALIKAPKGKDFCVFDRKIGRDRTRTFLSLKRLERTDVFAAHIITAYLRNPSTDMTALNALVPHERKDKQ